MAHISRASEKIRSVFPFFHEISRICFFIFIGTAFALLVPMTVVRFTTQNISKKIERKDSLLQ